MFRAASFVPGMGPATRTRETGSSMMSHQPLGQNRMWYSCIMISEHLHPQRAQRPACLCSACVIISHGAHSNATALSRLKVPFSSEVYPDKASMVQVWDCIKGNRMCFKCWDCFPCLYFFFFNFKGICTQQEGSNMSNLDEVVVSGGVRTTSVEQNIYRRRTHLEKHECRPTWKWSEVTFPSGLSF